MADALLDPWAYHSTTRHAPRHGRGQPRCNQSRSKFSSTITALFIPLSLRARLLHTLVKLKVVSGVFASWCAHTIWHALGGRTQEFAGQW
eukprot:scaffold15075_cov60-Phaeocystis_antarctica.AAC.2